MGVSATNFLHPDIAVDDNSDFPTHMGTHTYDLRQAVGGKHLCRQIKHHENRTHTHHINLVGQLGEETVTLQYIVKRASEDPPQYALYLDAVRRTEKESGLTYIDTGTNQSERTRSRLSDSRGVDLFSYEEVRTKLKRQELWLSLDGEKIEDNKDTHWSLFKEAEQLVPENTAQPEDASSAPFDAPEKLEIETPARPLYTAEGTKRVGRGRNNKPIDFKVVKLKASRASTLKPV